MSALVNGQWLVADDTDHLRLAPVEIAVEPGVRRLELTFEVAA